MKESCWLSQITKLCTMGPDRERRDEQVFRVRKGDRQHAADIQEAWVASQRTDRDVWVIFPSHIIYILGIRTEFNYGYIKK
jgi:hypothetical protein